MASIKLDSDSASRALKWISQILNKHHIPYQITGGLAAQVHGSHRPLIDIDIDLPNAAITQILPEISPYLRYGPRRYHSREWDILLATLNYHGQLIDLSGADDGLIFDRNAQQWVQCKVDFSTVQWRSIAGLQVPVIAKSELIHYKSILCREVDLMDIAAIKNRH